MDGDTAASHQFARSDDDQSNAVIWLWHSTPLDQHFIVNKLLTGGFRVGVSTGLISRAIAEAFDLEESLVVQRLMGGFEPSAERFIQLTASATRMSTVPVARPTPFISPVPWSRNGCGRHQSRIGNWNGNGMGSVVS